MPYLLSPHLGRLLIITSNNTDHSVPIETKQPNFNKMESVEEKLRFAALLVDAGIVLITWGLYYKIYAVVFTRSYRAK